MTHRHSPRPPVRGEVSRSQKILRALKEDYFPYSPGEQALPHHTHMHGGGGVCEFIYCATPVFECCDQLLLSAGFRFPLPFLGAIVAMSMLLYQVSQGGYNCPSVSSELVVLNHCTCIPAQLTITIVIGGISLTATLPAAFNRDLAPLLGNLSRLSNNSLYISELTDLFKISFIGIPGEDDLSLVIQACFVCGPRAVQNHWLCVCL